MTLARSLSSFALHHVSRVLTCRLAYLPIDGGKTKQEHDSVEEEPALISFEQMCSAYPKPDKPGNFLNDAMRFWESFDTATRHAAIDGVKVYIEQHPRYSDQVFLNRYLRERLWLSTNPNAAELA